MSFHFSPSNEQQFQALLPRYPHKKSLVLPCLWMVQYQEGYISLEAMAYGTAEVIEAMEADSGVRTEELRVDGGAALNDWLMEFQAGVLGVVVRRPQSVETTALGAAALAGVHTGMWPSAEAYVEALGPPQLFEPRMSDHERDELRRGWSRAVAATRSWALNPTGDAS